MPPHEGWVLGHSQRGACACRVTSDNTPILLLTCIAAGCQVGSQNAHASLSLVLPADHQRGTPWLMTFPEPLWSKLGDRHVHWTAERALVPKHHRAPLPTLIGRQQASLEAEPWWGTLHPDLNQPQWAPHDSGPHHLPVVKHATHPRAGSHHSGPFQQPPAKGPASRKGPLPKQRWGHYASQQASPPLTDVSNQVKGTSLGGILPLCLLSCNASVMYELSARRLCIQPVCFCLPDLMPCKHRLAVSVWNEYPCYSWIYIGVQSPTAEAYAQALHLSGSLHQQHEVFIFVFTHLSMSM